MVKTMLKTPIVVWITIKLLFTGCPFKILDEISSTSKTINKPLMTTLIR